MSLSPLRILLINSLNPNVEVEGRYPSLGLGYLASSARKALPGERLEFLVADKDIRKAADGFRPHLAGISSVSQNFDIAKARAAYFAAKGIPVVMGGVHASALPETVPDGVAAACLGESEDTLVDIIRAMLGGGLTPGALSGIPGIAYRDGGRLAYTEARPQKADMDTIPMPARDLLDIRPHTYMFTSRGCPYRCTFCSSSRFWDKLRFFSAEYVVDEIGTLVRDHGVTMISFFDDLFVANFKRVEEIVVLLEKRGLLGKVRYTCSCRANVVKPELAALLKRMGVVSVGMGLESGDDDVLRYLKGGQISVAQNHRAVDILKGAGIAANGSFVIGSPDETREQVMRTYSFIKESRLDLFDVYLLTPFPGTPLWEDAKARGLVTDNMDDWSRLDVNVYRDPGKAVIMSGTLSREEVIALYKKFRRLRLVRNAVKVLGHPMKKDIPRMAWRLLVERVSGLVRPRP